MRRHALLSTGLLLALSFGVGVATTRAQPARPDGELRRKGEEVERLEEELRRARQELERLRKENQTLRQSPAPAAALPSNPAPAVLPADLPAIQETNSIPAGVLVEHFRADAAAADARYRDRVFLVTGEVVDFETALLGRTYSVRLHTPERLVRVVCRFNYVDKYRSVMTRDKGRTLVGRIDDRAARVLFRLGDQVVIRGRCQGMKDEEILLTGCGRVE
jgi:hypothetical protein